MKSIGETIREARLRMGINQSALAELSKIPQGTISKIENGRIARPEQSQLAQLALHLELELDDLLAAMPSETHLVVQDPDAQPSEILVGAGYCIWASALYYEIRLKGFVEGAEITSYGTGGLSDDAATPYFYRQADQPIKMPPKLQALGKGAGPGAEGLQRHGWDQGTKFSFYSAKELFMLLADEELNVLIVPGDLYEANQNDIVRVARIMTTAGGGCILSIIYQEGAFDCPDEYREDGHAFVPAELWSRSQLENHERPKLIYPIATVAENQMNLFVPKGTYEPLGTEIGDISRFLGLIRDTLEADKVVLLLIWEPQTSIVKNYLSATQPSAIMKNIEIQKTSHADSAPLITFDVFFDRRKIDDLLANPKTFIFLDDLRKAVAKVARLQKENNVQVFAERVKDFFGMQLGDCERALKDIDFEFMYHTEWVDLLRNHWKSDSKRV
jgi:transcriptional regulator with XRE-family HTH domain